MINQKQIELEYCIIGSGPSGIACALGLTERGVKVTMIDVGKNLPHTAEKIIQQYQKEPRARSTLFDIKNIYQQAKRGKKLHYGFDYVYEKAEQAILIEQNNVNITSSFSKGGLSNVWGASFLPFSKSEFTAWPISFEKISEYYSIINAYINPAQGNYQAEKNQLSHLFNPSPQASWLFKKWQKKSHTLSANNITFSSSTLAVNFNHCSYCGGCMYGCPTDLIYSSKHTLRQLQIKKNFSYIDQHLVTSIKEFKSHVQINCIKPDNTPVTYFSKKIFLACGPLQTAIILINSAITHKVNFIDSQYFSIPAMTLKRFKNVNKQNIHTLCQSYLSMSEQRLTLQLNTYMDFIDLELAVRFGRFLKFINILRDRMVVFQGYLHSDHSSQLQLEKNDQDNRFKLSLQKNNRSHQIINECIANLTRNSHRLGLIPINPLLAIGLPGESKHYGGSFPMRTTLTGNTSDLYGRPNQSIHIHIVDASIFPTIPSQSPTLTIMANAYRIAQECEL